MKVLLTATSFKPEYGGPSRSVSHLAAALQDAGVEAAIWAADDSAISNSFLKEGSSVHRLSGSLARVTGVWAKPDIVHDNDLWLPHHVKVAQFANQANSPRLISTRGMLEPWAIQYKYWKKIIVWHLYQKKCLRTADCIHATSQQEADNLQRWLPDLPACIIPNGVHLPAHRPSVVKNSSSQTALFLGRLHPVKGLPLLLKAWAKVKPTGWTLKIVGPDEGNHRQELEQQAATLGLQGIITFHPATTNPDTKDEFFRTADLFILPSHSENFGIVIAEAMAYGLPVLTTHGTPWQLLEKEHCGWWVPVDAASIAAALKDATEKTTQQRTAMGQRGRTIVSQRYSWQQVAQEFISTYNWLLNPHPRPTSVITL